ncbi:S100 calcium binding protein U [Cyprinodon tularosa]|uniref:S100 calcium binding protein U n=1 Tax=Cyprinodon tularosa TaxID=77115 RepID=UPI0018E1F22A|nr:S100 calcium binding protein U [Cyprinodon tularosa]XP_038135234.1 S100 calcium binding protein U [Cyprinodon tularosa]
MEGAIQAVVKTFLKSAKGKDTLGKKEFQSLVSSQLGNILTDTESKEAIDNMGKQLDSDNDGKVGFEEYMKLIGYLACSLSEQRGRNKEEAVKNATSEQVAQSSPDKAAEQPKENAEPKEDGKQKENEETKADVAAEAKVEAKVDANMDGKVEAKAEGETKPEAAAVEAAASVEAEVKATEPEKAEETPNVDSTEKSPDATEEEGAEKTKEASS